MSAEIKSSRACSKYYETHITWKRWRLSCLRHEGTAGVEVTRHSFLISALDRGEWSISRLGRSLPNTDWSGG